MAAGVASAGWVALLFVLSVARVHAAVLPEDRSDIMYHYYDGGGVTVSGPAVLVRKGVSDNVSLSGRYYVDTVSSASIDVVTTASPYTDRREEMGVGVDYLRGNSLMSMSMISSKENDYQSDTFSLGVAHDLFGGLTTLSFGFAHGNDLVMRVDNNFAQPVERFSFRLGLTQVLSRNLLFGVSFEDVAEDGYLSNPYRSARLLGASLPERYPETRDSRALAFRLIKGFGTDDRALGRSIRGDYRYFRDTWDIEAHTLGLTFQRYFSDRWIGALRYRYYQQNAASFYSDNFAQEMTFMARDKELSSFQSHSLGVKFSWQFTRRKLLFFERATLNFSHDYVRFDYDDFTDVRNGEPYSYGADILQLYISAWY